MAHAETPKAVSRFFEFLRDHELAHDGMSSAVYQVYQDLAFVRGWTNLRVLRGERTVIYGIAPADFDSVHPKATYTGGDRTQAIVPIPVFETLSPRILESIGSSIRHPDTGAALRCVTIAIVDTDSTTAYYRVFTDFDEIVHPQWKQKKAQDGRGDNTAEWDGSDDDDVSPDGDTSASEADSGSQSGSNSADGQ